MGYGLGVLLLAIGLILALAVRDSIEDIDLTLIGWILAGVGLLAIVLTAVTTMRARGSSSATTTTHSDGSQTTTQSRHETDPPPAV
jgi:hypothetical protein